MTRKQASAIKKLHALEFRAAAIQLRLNAVRREWEKFEEIAKSDKVEWEAYCDKMGLAPNYNFGDCLC